MLHQTGPPAHLAHRILLIALSWHDSSHVLVTLLAAVAWMDGGAGAELGKEQTMSIRFFVLKCTAWREHIIK